MKGRLPSLILLPLLLFIGGCGGSSPNSSTTTKIETQPGTITVATAPPAAASSTTAPSATTAPATAPPAAKQKHERSVPAAPNVYIRAAFRIGSGDRLTPPSIAVPASVAIEVTVSSTDGRAHSVLIKTPTKHSLKVPAGGRASILIPGQRKGKYQVEVDSAVRGMLITGVAPGP